MKVFKKKNKKAEWFNNVMMLAAASTFTASIVALVQQHKAELKVEKIVSRLDAAEENIEQTAGLLERKGENRVHFGDTFKWID